MQTLLRNPLLKLALIFGLAYGGLLILGQMGVSASYRTVIRNASTDLFQQRWSKGFVQFQEKEDTFGKGLETAISFVNREENARAAANGTSVKAVTVYFSIHTWGYILGTFLVSLIIASPVSIKRKLIASSISLAVFHLYLIVRIWLKLEWEMDAHPELGILELSSFASGVLDVLNTIFVQNIVVSFLTVTLIWILVTFRREDWKTFSALIRK